MKTISDSLREELTALETMADEDIDFSDIPETTPEYWEGAMRGRFYRAVCATPCSEQAAPQAAPPEHS